MGWFTKQKESPDMAGLEAEALLQRAKEAADPSDRFAYLKRAEEISPDDLKVQRALLMHGRLHERNPKRIDYSVIKCYLFHVFEHPGDHSEETRKNMARELFDDAGLQKCLALCDNRDVFLCEYLQELSAQYVHLFIAGDSRHVPGILGIVQSGKIPKYIAAPSRDVLLNILSSPFLDEREQSMLAVSFYRAFSGFVNGQTEHLDSLLGPDAVRCLNEKTLS